MKWCLVYIAYIMPSRVCPALVVLSIQCTLCVLYILFVLCMLCVLCIICLLCIQCVLFILGWVILYKVGQWISSCHFYYAKFNSEQLLFYWCIWKKLIYLRKFGPEDFVYPYIKSNFKFWILKVVIYPEMHIEILRLMVKELALSDLPL